MLTPFLSRFASALRYLSSTIPVSRSRCGIVQTFVLATSIVNISFFHGTQFYSYMLPRRAPSLSFPISLLLYKFRKSLSSAKVMFSIKVIKFYIFYKRSKVDLGGVLSFSKLREKSLTIAGSNRALERDNAERLLYT